MWASPVPTLYACCLTKRNCIFFCCTCPPLLLILRFCGLILVPPDGPKNGTVKVLSFVLFLSGACGPKKWDRLGSFLKFFVCIKVAEAQRFGFNEGLLLVATGRATRKALLSEAGFEKVFRTQNWVRRSKLFCR